MSSRRHVALALALLLAPLGARAADSADMPGVDVTGLEKDEVTALSDLMREGACPCDTKQSLLACLQAKSCPSATELASFGAKKFREGLGPEQVREAVVKKYLDDHVTRTFDLSKSPKKGADNGKIVIVEFADFECPHCALVAKMMPQVLKAYPKDVTLYFKYFPLPMHTYAETAARATWAAGQQGKFWPMHDLIFENQAALSDEKFVELAQELGLNLEKFKADLKSDGARDAVNRDRDEGIKAELTGTPTLFINGKLYYDEKTPEALTAYIKQALAKAAGGKAH